MKLVYKIASSIGALALALVSLTSCEGSEMYGVDSPGWISNKVDSIANSKSLFETHKKININLK